MRSHGFRARRLAGAAGPERTQQPAATLGSRQSEQLAAIARLSAHALTAPALDDLMLKACCAAAEALGVSHVGVFERDRDAERLATRACIGWHHDTTLSVSDTHVGAALVDRTPVMVADWSTEERFACPEPLREAGVTCGLTVPVRGAAEAFGALDVQCVERRSFDDDDAHFLEAIASVIGSAFERRRSEDRIRHQGVHDPLTGLPNRNLFKDRLTQALEAAWRHRRTLAVLFLDIDDFKRANDMLGHSGGDELLIEVARRIHACLRSADTLARFGGDEFAILLQEVDGVIGAKTAATRVLDALRPPIEAGERRINLTASIGVALGGGFDRRPPDELVRNADLAMYAAKEQGRARMALYAEKMHDAARSRVETISDLQRDVLQDLFVVHYQPIVALADGRLSAVEALVRWDHPTKGLLAPGLFLALAEETELIVAIGRSVLRQACGQVRAWQVEHPAFADLQVNVNLAAQQVHAYDLIPNVSSALQDAELAPEHLVLEVTEHVLVGRDEGVDRTLGALKNLGIRLAVDDFGTGYSALSYLQRFPIDTLKVDKSFVDQIGSSVGSDNLVAGIISLAHVLELDTVAEGIETAEQASALRAMHSELGQGFYFAKPLAAPDMDDYLRDAAARPTLAGGR
jgi:diguanylate cyclase (GGDEF)-like protein